MLSLSQPVFLTNVEPAGAVDLLLQLLPNSLGKHLPSVVIDPVGNGLTGVFADQAGHFSAARPGQAESLIKIGGAIHELPGPALERADRIGHRSLVRLGQAGFLPCHHVPPVPRSSASLGRGRGD